MALWENLPDRLVETLEPGLIIQRNKIPTYRLEEFGECANTWRKWEQKSLLPYAGGWREQPADVIQVLDVFDNIYAAYMKQEGERQERIAEGKRKMNARKR